VIDHRKGTGWLVDRVAELSVRHQVRQVFADGSGPAGSLIVDMDRAGVSVQSLSRQELAQSCGVLFDLVEQGGVRHLGSQELVLALRSAAPRQLGDAWYWSRRLSGGDISPLVAATIAIFGVSSGKAASTARAISLSDL